MAEIPTVRISHILVSPSITAQFPQDFRPLRMVAPALSKFDNKWEVTPLDKLKEPSMLVLSNDTTLLCVVTNKDLSLLPSGWLLTAVKEHGAAVIVSNAGKLKLYHASLGETHDTADAKFKKRGRPFTGIKLVAA